MSQRSKPLDLEGKARLFVALGKKDRMNAAKLVELIVNKASVESRQVGDIEIMDNFSFVTVPFDVAEKIVIAFRERGQKPLITHANNPRSSSGRDRKYRSRGRNYEGGYSRTEKSDSDRGDKERSRYRKPRKEGDFKKPRKETDFKKPRWKKTPQTATGRKRTGKSPIERKNPSQAKNLDLKGRVMTNSLNCVQVHLSYGKRHALKKRDESSAYPRYC